MPSADIFVCIWCACRTKTKQEPHRARGGDVRRWVFAGSLDFWVLRGVDSLQSPPDGVADVCMSPHDEDTFEYMLPLLNNCARLGVKRLMRQSSQAIALPVFGRGRRSLLCNWCPLDDADSLGLEQAQRTDVHRG